MPTFDEPRAILDAAVTSRAFPAAVVEVGDRRAARWQEAFGSLTYEPGSPPATLRTLFDLASLTKPLATASVALRLVQAGVIGLDDRLADRLRHWRGDERASATIRDLLEHCAGLTGYLPFYADHTGRADFERTICELPLEYPPRTKSIYSDLGFMLLAFLLEDAAGGSLDALFDPVSDLVAPEPLLFDPPRAWRDRIAPTELDPWRGRLLVGEVHDENAWALGRVAGHAGLFGTAAAVGRFARLVLETLQENTALMRSETLRVAVRRSTVPGSSRALGWDTMLPTSSCGTRMSASAIGHTGFTGTSLWIDPAADLYVVLLTNRVHPSRENDAIQKLRPALHDAIVAALERAPRMAP